MSAKLQKGVTFDEDEHLEALRVSVLIKDVDEVNLLLASDN